MKEATAPISKDEQIFQVEEIIRKSLNEKISLHIYNGPNNHPNKNCRH